MKRSFYLFILMIFFSFHTSFAMSSFSLVSDSIVRNINRSLNNKTIVDSTVIDSYTFSNPLQVLHGKIPGVELFNLSGQLGCLPMIRIRGASSFIEKGTSLMMVDGHIYYGSLAEISLNDIASIQVLTDAVSLARYGVALGGGVVSIKTKGCSGTVKKNNITAEIRASIGFSERGVKRYKTVNSKEWYQYAWESLRNHAIDEGNSNPGLWASQELINKVGTNCYKIPKGEFLVDPVSGKLNRNASLLFNDNLEDILFRTGVNQNYGASVSGNLLNTGFRISIGKTNQKGIISNSEMDISRARIRLNSNITNNLRIGINGSFSKETSVYQDMDPRTVNHLFNTILEQAPIYSQYMRDHNTGKKLYDSNGRSILDYGTGKNGEYNKKYKRGSNILEYRDYKYEIKKFNYSGNINLEYEPIKGLIGRFEYFKRKIDYNIPNHPSKKRYENVLKDWKSEDIYLESFREKISYSNKIEKFNYSIEGSHEYFYSKNNNKSIYKYLYNGSFYRINQDYTKKHTRENYLFNFKLDYKSKYFIEGIYKKENISTVGNDKNWSNNFALSSVWEINKENFLIKYSWINRLNIEFSYGQFNRLYPYQFNYGRGNQNYDYKNYFNPKDNFYAYKKDFRAIVKKINLRSNFILFDGLISGAINYFRDRYTNLVYSRIVPKSSGNIYLMNSGRGIQNQGMEYYLNLNPFRNDFKWNISVNLTHYKNEIIELEEDIQRYGNMAYQKGKSLYEYYMYESAGINPDNGNYLWYKDVYKRDQNGNILKDKYNNPVIDHKEKTEDANEATEKWMGTAFPDFYGGISNSFSYKGFNLIVDLAYSVGGKILDHNYTNLISRNFSGYGLALHSDISRRWRNVGDKTDIPRLVWFSSQSGLGNTDRNLVDASYLNINNVSLSYSIPKKMVNAIGLKNIKFSFSIHNLAHFSHREGLNSMSNIRGGEIEARYPILRTYTFGTIINI